MRRRHVRAIHHEERQPLLLMAAGAIAGAAAGLYLGRRYSSLDAFLGDMRERFDALRDVWYDGEEVESGARERLRALAEDDDGDEKEEDFEDDDEDEIEEEDDVESEALADEESEDDFDDDDLDDADDDLDDEFEDDLASVVRANGSARGSRNAESEARRLEERVLNALRDEPVLRERAIEIAVVGEGVVELTGAVRAIEEITRAAALARRIPGVSMVLNRIEVRTGGHMETASAGRDVAGPSVDPHKAPPV